MLRSLFHCLIGSVVPLAGVFALVALSPACADVDRGLGESCIRDSDCLSGVCAGQVCVAQPTLFDAAPARTSTADGGLDAADAALPVEAAVDSANDSARESAGDTGSADANDGAVARPEVGVPDSGPLDAHDADDAPKPDAHDASPVDAPADTHPKAG